MKTQNRTAFACCLVLLCAISISPDRPGYANKVEINDFVIDVMKEEISVQEEEEEDNTKDKKWIVQFSGPIHEGDKQQLLRLNCRIHDYIPDFAFIVTMNDKAKKDVLRLSFIQGVSKYRPEHKIRKSLKEKIDRVAAPSAIQKKGDNLNLLKIHIRVDGAEHLPLLLSAVQQAKGKILDVGKDVAKVQLSAEAIGRIALLEEVLWIEEAVDLQLLNDTSRWTIQTYQPGYTKIWDMGILGEGQIIGIGDTGLDYDMPWFRDPAHTIGPDHRKVIGYTAYTDDYDGNFGHGTHVACTAAGNSTPVDGSSVANGMAPESRLFIQDITPGEERAVYPPSDLGLMFITPYSSGAHLHSNSWGSAANAYETYARTTDLFMWEHQDFLALFANGNSGDAEGTVGTPATAKNVVSAGATGNGMNAEDLAIFSSNGPTADGRIKPTVTAPGVAIISADSDGLKESYNNGTISYSGTSMATPTVAGAAALIRQYYVDGYWPYGSPNPDMGLEPSAALIKATLINSARNMNGDNIDGPLPSTGQGWGRINLADTLHFFPDTNFLDIADIATGLTTGASWSQRYFSTGEQFLKVTLVWTDYPGMEGAARELVNDLDLLVMTPEGETYRGNVFANGISVTGGTADQLNVEEQVLIPTYQAGNYTVTVTGYNVPFGPQPFAVVVTGAVNITSRGFIDLDKTKYNHESTIRVQVADQDLNMNSSVADEVNIVINSASEPDGEIALLVESGPDTSVFIGTIQTAPVPAIADNGYLEIAEGDCITAAYLDENDGTGNPKTFMATAVADLTAPIISGTMIESVGQDNATILWTTDEPVSATIYYGESPASLAAFQADPWLLTSPVVQIGNLKENTAYFYKVSSTDEAGNISEDDNNGLLYSFTTLNLPPELTFYSSNLLDTYRLETVLYGTAIDPSCIGLIRITGNNLDQCVECRPSDGYYELAVSLAIGENPFTVAATDSLGNCQTRALTVTRREQPDLAVTSVIGPERGGFFQPIHVENTICNNGPGVSPGTGSINWYLSPDMDILPAEDIKLNLGYNHGNDIMPGECFTLSVDIRLSIPLSLVGNTYYLAAYADSGCEIWESDETNNIRLADSRITVEGADLEMSALSGPVHVQPGTGFTVFNTVRNIGLGTSVPFKVVMYLSTDAVITMNDIKIGDRYVNNLEPVGTPYPYPSESSADTGVLVGTTVPEGIYYIGAIIDPWNSFYEPNRDNNVLLGNQIEVKIPECLSDADCNDGLFCNGTETCDASGTCLGGTPVVVDDGVGCTADSCDEVNDVVVHTPNNLSCDDGLFCSGTETCDVQAGCRAGSDPCPGGLCSESLGACVACLSDANCDDGLFCTGTEICDASGACLAGTPITCAADGLFCNGIEVCIESARGCGSAGNPCGEGTVCDENYARCFFCGDGVCDPGEDCATCPGDCISGAGGGTCTTCFRGVCDGICNPKKDGPTCSDCLSSYCCGDSVCGRAENPCNCPLDCGLAREEVCDNGSDDDCDGKVDCDDSDCALFFSCICLAKNASCQSNADCCSGRCRDGKCR